MAVHNVKAPSSFTLKDGNTSVTATFDTKRLNNNLNKIQIYLDSRVGRYLKEYVSYKTGDQERSIDLANTYGKGYVKINVNYAVYQAYASWIKKRSGKRGTYPFERMKQAEGKGILNETQSYSRRLFNG